MLAGPRFTVREVPGGDVAAYVEGRLMGNENRAQTWACTGTVELALPAARVAPSSRDGIVEALGPERSRLTLGAWSWVAVAAAVARYDCEILAVSPPALAEAFRASSRRFEDVPAPPRSST